MAKNRFNPSGETRLRVHMWDAASGGYSHVKLTSCRLTTDCYGREYTTGLLSWPDPLRNVEVSCQIGGGITDRPYAFKLEVVEVTSVDAAKTALAVQTAFDRHLGALRERFGCVFPGDDFGLWVIAVAEALGVTLLGLDNEHWPSGIQWASPATAAEQINRFIDSRLKTQAASGAA